jgi:predicted DNA-binding transcriptional regulator AlpA
MTVVVTVEPILVNAETAAALLSISRSQFDKLVAEGALPAPTRRLGPPRWLVSALRQAVGEGATMPPTPPQEPAKEQDWTPQL